MWAVGVVRARGGVGTHWQPLNTLETPRKCKPGVSSGEAGVEWGVGGGGGEGAGGVWARIGSLLPKHLAKVVWCGRWG